MRSPVHPDEALAILESEVFVCRGHVDITIIGGVRAHDLNILRGTVHSLTLKGQIEQRQRVGRYQERAGGRGVIKENVARVLDTILVLVDLPHHPVSVDRRPVVGRVGIGHQDKGLRGVVPISKGRFVRFEYVQILAQGVGPATEQLRVLVIRIISRLAPVVLIIDTARSLCGGKVIGAHALRDDDLRPGGLRGIIRGVAADLARHKKILKFGARFGDSLEPAHRENFVIR